ncbi:bifunctional protein-serine/threonine kinase/phosphatase [Methylocystis sp. H62]|uniref:bifunctional protein-serine/threonine kinase/phosphatase n=1 Tax=Methylocystis sp. H62 TaxID=2785789 RepID=UPI0018C28247|nr:protein kinase [Methylocystis sp. H62]MBG0794700.1 bifunctional protein-serine/threonine kinase/phosphatase [Methylocystis sp. H62]
MSVRVVHDLRIEAGFATQKGRRPDNQDYVAFCLGSGGAGALQGVVAAVADGVGGHKGGRAAAETAVRAFIDGYYAQPETLGVSRAAARSLEAANSWIAAQSRVDPSLEGMATTFSTLILSRRTAFILHVGDTRVYRLAGASLERLTKDHTLGRGDFAHALLRAVGFDDALLFDQGMHSLNLHDRFLLCSDGVHGVLPGATLRSLLAERGGPQETSERIVQTALEAGSHDNVTALVVDVVDVPPADERALSHAFAALPIGELPAIGDLVDEFRIDGLLSEGRYSRLMRATDTQNGKAVVLKFPHPRVADDAAYRLAFVNEAWVAARVRSPFVGEVVELLPGRQSRLYSVMPYYDGETLERRLRREPRIDLAEGASIATRLARAIATLHRCGVIHRDIKPDNIILLKDGGLRLVDLGVCRAPNLENLPEIHAPGTPSYMAPELFDGAAGDEASDLYAFGVTIYRMFSRCYPYGEIEPFSRPRFSKPLPLALKRPDLPAWLDAAILKAIAVARDDRFGDVLEFAFELENGSARGQPLALRKKSLYERNPLIFWQTLCLLLALFLAVSLFYR